MTSAKTHRSAEEIGRTGTGPRPLPELGSQKAAADLSTVDTVLPNGLRVIAVQRATVPMVEVRLRVPFADPAGLEHRFAALRGGRDPREHRADRHRERAPRVQIDTELALVGGELDAVVDPERLSFTGNALATGLGTVLDVLRGRADRRVVPGRRGRARARPPGRAHHDRPVAAERHRARGVAAGPVRRPPVRQGDAGRRRGRRCQPRRRAGVAPQGVAAARFGARDRRRRRAVRRGRADRRGTRVRGRATARPSSCRRCPSVKGGDVLFVHRAGAVQSQIRLAAQAIPRTDERYPALQLANLVYGGFFSSRLVENIREDKGYTYSARSHPEFTVARRDAADRRGHGERRDGGGAAGDPLRAGASRPGAADGVRSGHRAQLRDRLAAHHHVVAVRSRVVPREPRRHWASASTGWSRTRSGSRNVTPEQVAAAALEFFAPGNFTGVLVGDAEQLTPKLKALGGVALDGTAGQ